MDNLNLNAIIKDNKVVIVDDFNNVYKAFDTLAVDTELEIEKVRKEIQNGTLIIKNIKFIKEYKIKQSKQRLEEFLQNNPLLYNEKFYSVTKEKQTLLANALQVYQMKIQAGMSPILTWNATGEECTEWTLEELSALALAIAEYVEPLVTHQQTLEVRIRNCETIEELEGIEINYETV